MKTKLLFLSIALTMLLSCSGDDGANADVTPAVEKKIHQIKRALKSPGNDFWGVFDYVDNKLVNTALYYGDTPASTNVYVYDADGRVSKFISTEYGFTTETTYI